MFGLETDDENFFLLPYNTVFLLAAVFVFRVFFSFSPSMTRRQKYYFLPLERFLFQCAHFSFHGAHSSLWSSSSPLFYFPKSLHNQNIFFPGFLEKKLFFQDFWNQLFTQAGFILKTFSKGKKIIFCMEFLKIICLGEFCFLSNVVPKAQAFLSPQTFSFASMTSLFFNIVLPGS